MKGGGRFVVLEGGVGVGKTTQWMSLQKELSGWNFYREPGGTSFGEKVRDAVQGDPNQVVDKYAALFAYSAARANLVRGVIIPKLQEGQNILLDRYWYSTYAYQGAEGVSKSVIFLVSMIATHALKPDLVLHYDLLPEIGIKRKSGKKDVDRYDVQELEFHQKVRRNYHQLKRFHPRIWEVIDASRQAEEVFENSLAALRKANIIP